eukprot:CAMPEP_0170532814 /NCGR_PEP_ID=MMETSP0209-20121228/76069_1 /TAXON_ID=665100 ORGANISM="Litonotus pictus, Strain P1" /NCGR_SAMPLE_ID=MMETSP0209 /ASSEMBLY_ACC=CAM_ASM_000301 /LENGTH=35 /DNA_ID= /DNA_START= /DNA_END= /DNA_ORIENTATION=
MNDLYLMEDINKRSINDNSPEVDFKDDLVSAKPQA